MSEHTSENRLKAAWGRGESTLGLWLSSPDRVGAEILGDVDFDYINIDMQHGLIDYNDMVGLLQSMVNAEATLTCRVPWNEPGIIGKVLDAGAMGVIIPMVNSVAEAEQAVRACRYAPEGSRSFGPIRTARVNGPGYYDGANAQVACIPMIETAQAIADLDNILDVPGIDAVYVGPADLSISLGLPPGSDQEDASFNEAITKVIDGCNARGIVAGIHSVPNLVAKRLEQGFRMVTVTSDTAALASGAVAALKTARSGAGGSSDEKMY